MAPAIFKKQQQLQDQLGDNVSICSSIKAFNSICKFRDNIAPSEQEQKLIKPTLKRYLILLLFCLNAGNKAFQWIQIPASTKKVSYYYDVSNFVINSTSVLFMTSFFVLSLPSVFIIDRIGIRNAVLIGSGGTAIGTLVKCFCCQQTTLGVCLLFLGQLIVSLGEQFIFSVPSRLASVWFPDNQVSSAVAMTILWNSLGVALGFMVPQLMLEFSETRDQIGQQLYYMFLANAILSIFAFVVCWFFFDEAPKYAPGAARLKQIESERYLESQQSQSSWVQIIGLVNQAKRLYCDINFTLLVLAFGINIGLGYTMHTILNQILEPLWPDDDILVGNCGFFMIASGALGSALFGHILDRYHKYKLTNILLTLTAAITMLAFGFVLCGMRSRLAIYLVSCLMGMCQIGLVVAGLELAVELTYPEPELLASTMMNISPQIFGCIGIYIGSYIIDNHGPIYTNIFFICCFLLALLMLCCIRETLNRQNAAHDRKMHTNDTPMPYITSEKNSVIKQTDATV